MTNQFFKQVGKSATDTARAMAKQMVREPLEMGKSIKSQVGLGEKKENPISPSVSSIPATETPKMPEIDEEMINRESSMKLAELQGEVRRLIDQRKQLSEDWKKIQDEKMGVSQNIKAPEKPLIQPTSKKKRGFTGPAKGKQGTKEMSKSPSG